jgi:hypothetical protein
MGFGAGRTAPMVPKMAVMTVEMAKALRLALKNLSGSAMAASMGGMVKCTKKRNATEPNAVGNAARFTAGTATQLKPSWEAQRVMSDFSATGFNSKATWFD